MELENTDYRYIVDHNTLVNMFMGGFNFGANEGPFPKTIGALGAFDAMVEGKEIPGAGVSYKLNILKAPMKGNMTLSDFQLALLLKAKQLGGRAGECLQDCVNYSGDYAYELNARHAMDDTEVIRKTIGYQLTRLKTPETVVKFLKSFGIGGFTGRRFITVNELLSASTEVLNSITSECRKDGNFRCKGKGISNIQYDKNTQTLEWSDEYGDPTVYNVGPEDQINFNGGDGTWDYALYFEEDVK